MLKIAILDALFAEVAPAGPSPMAKTNPKAARPGRITAAAIESRSGQRRSRLLHGPRCAEHAEVLASCNQPLAVARWHDRTRGMVCCCEVVQFCLSWGHLWKGKLSGLSVLQRSGLRRVLPVVFIEVGVECGL